MAVVRNTLSPVPVEREVTVRLIAPAGWRANGDLEVVTGWTAKIDEGGTWGVDLPAQSTYVAEGTWYQVSEPRATHAIVVPDASGPHQLYDLLVSPVPTSSGWTITPAMSQLRDATALATATDGQVPTWDSDAAQWVPGSSGSGGVVTDHGALTGLADDDHAIYQLRSEKGVPNGYAGLDESAKVLIGRLPTGSTGTTVPLGDHTHDVRYYTEPEIDVALGGKANISHGHSTADLTSGTIDIARIPLGATSVTVAVGDDTRLSDSRTPTAHAIGHATGGADELTPADIGAAEHGSIYPLIGYGFHSASCLGESATIQSSFSSWHLRLWIPGGNAITKAGMVVTIAATPGSGGLNAVAIYADDGQSFLGQTVDDDNWLASTGLRTINMQGDIPAAPGGRFVRVVVNVEVSSAPNVCYAAPADTPGGTLNGTGTLQRRSAYKSAYSGSFPTTIDPDTLGTPTNFLPFIVLG